jgi:hypothetical protein
MKQETFTLNQKELQRVSVISACIKGDLACASAAELLSLSLRHVKRLKKRLREAGEGGWTWPGNPAGMHLLVSHGRGPDRSQRAMVAGLLRPLWSIEARRLDLASGT